MHLGANTQPTAGDLLDGIFAQLDPLTAQLNEITAARREVTHTKTGRWRKTLNDKQLDRLNDLDAQAEKLMNLINPLQKQATGVVAQYDGVI